MLEFVLSIKGINENITFKGLVHPKIKISPCFTHPQCILGIYDFLLLNESNWSNKKNCLGFFKLYRA